MIRLAVYDLDGDDLVATIASVPQSGTLHQASRRFATTYVSLCKMLYRSREEPSKHSCSLDITGVILRLKHRLPCFFYLAASHSRNHRFAYRLIHTLPCAAV